MIKRQWDPVNGVWMRVIPNLGMSFAEFDAEMDQMVIEVVERSPAFAEYVFELARRQVDVQASMP